MISREEALARLLDGVSPLPAELVPLGAGAGRVIAEDIDAAHDQPPGAISAMDGYAVPEADARIGAVLRLIGEAPAGRPFEGAVGPGEAVRIATGGIVPEGAERIVIQEHVTLSGGKVRIDALSKASFVRPAGGDFRNGARLVAAGELLSPARIGLIAAAGRAEVRVTRRPRVAIFASGDELREPGATLMPGAIFNSAAFALAALAEQCGAAAHQIPILPDDAEQLNARLDATDLDFDVLVPLGGASVGEWDLLPTAFERLGARIQFNRVAVIPGKPTWHARWPNGRLLLGLPGNPASAFVCAHLFLRPLLARLTGQRFEQPLSSGILSTGIGKNGGREAWLRAVATNSDSAVQIAVGPRQDSSLQTPLAAANALVLRAPEAQALQAGERVQFLPISTS
jgi:molybdopterin molybdotransferase